MTATTLPVHFDDIFALSLADKALIYQGLSFAIDNQLCTSKELDSVRCFFDARGLSCPMPLLKVKIALRGMNADETLCLIATDNHAQIDLVAYCQKNGLAVRTWQYGQTEAMYYFLITQNSQK